MKATTVPLSESERILSLDVLRGFALLGILMMNIGAFSMPTAAYFDPTAYGDLTGLNGWVWRVNHVLADLKFMAVFSMLFGAGIVLMSDRCDFKGQAPTGLHYRRMIWLVFFGLLHAHLLWYGDILYGYGLCGLVVYLFRKLSPQWLIVWSLLLIAFASGLMLAAGASTEYWPPSELELLVAKLKPPPEMVANEVAVYQRDWLEQMAKRVPQAFEMETSNFFFWGAWRISGLMLLGMALFKLGVFNAKCSRRFYMSLIALALIVGIPVIIYGIQYNVATDWEAPGFFFFGLQFNYWGSIFVSLGWVSAVMLACQVHGLSSLMRPLAAVGRTAFSNYILQTLLCTTIFYGHGFGLFGQVERAGQAAIVIAVWAFQLIVSPLWLNHFKFGPLEWLWRSLVYLNMQPFRRA